MEQEIRRKATCSVGTGPGKPMIDRGHYTYSYHLFRTRGLKIEVDMISNIYGDFIWPKKVFSDLSEGNNDHYIFMCYLISLEPEIDMKL